MGRVASRRVGSGQGDPARPVKFEHLLTGPVPTRDLSKCLQTRPELGAREFGKLLT